MDLDFDLAQELERAIPHLPTAPASSHLGAGRRARRRRHADAGVAGVAALALTTEERSALFDALQELPPMQKRTVVLRHWLGFLIEETAAELGVSIGTVKGHSSRGVAALRGLLDSQQVDC